MLRHFSTGSLPALAVLILLLVYYVIIDPNLLSTYQITSLLNLAAPYIIVAFAQMLVVLTGGVDLSVGSVVGLASAISATTFATNAGAGNYIHALGLALLAGVVAGLINGALVAWGRLPAIIVTLATLSLWQGVTLYILPAPAGTAPAGLTNILTGNTGPISNVLYLLVPLIILMWIFTQRSRSGRSIYQVGDDEGAAYTSGVPVIRAKFLAYALAGLLSAIAGIFITAQTSSADPLVNQVYTLNSVTAIVIGGTSLLGGIGSVWGSIYGASILAVIVALLPFANIQSFWQEIFSGVILIAALGLRSGVAIIARRR